MNVAALYILKSVFLIAHKFFEQKINNPLEMYLSDIYTIPVNLAGVPAISLPGGITNQNLPLGIQLIGKAFDEENLYQIAYAFEQETRWHKKLYNVRE